MKTGACVILLFIATTTNAQQSETGVWLGLQLPVTFNEKWQWHNDAGYRTIGFTQAAYQYLYRTGIRYCFNRAWSATAGTAFFFTRHSYQQKDHEFGKEFRLWQEVNFNKPLVGQFYLQNRIRTEERWFEASGNNKAYYGFRFRYRLSGLQKLSDRWGVQLADEYMQQSAHKKFTFNQNRLMLSALYGINPTTQFQFGYMWLLRPSSLSQHILTLTFQKNISVNGRRQEHHS